MFKTHRNHMSISAESYLIAAIETIEERGKQYDQLQQQERSMESIVAAFNIITGLSLTESQGWLFMMCLKLVRLNTDPNIFHDDSAIDLISYAALSAECGGKKNDRD
jgi:hypothetical protein